MPRRHSTPSPRQRANRRATGAVRRRSPSRADKLARARELVREPRYPPPQVIRAVAQALAKQWTVAQRSGPAAAPVRSRSHRLTLGR